MYALLGLSLGLVGFLLVGSLTSALVALILCRGGLCLPARAGGRARLLFALHLFPTLAGLVFAAAFYAPAYLLLEPRDTGETVSPGLALLAVAAAVLLLNGLRRGVQSWAEAQRLAAGWMKGARPWTRRGLGLPAYRIPHPFPVVAVVGVVRPRLFVAERVLAELGEEELAAVLAHEAGHLAARDNLKGLLLRCCPDPLALVPLGDRLCRAWAEAAEVTADERAAGPGGALALAEALVKVARMARAGERASLPASAFHDGTGIAERVERLLARTAAQEASASPPRAWGAWALGPVLAVTATSPAVLRAVHAWTEAALRFLR
jgi:Zn-dependent protease with chaperone function